MRNTRNTEYTKYLCYKNTSVDCLIEGIKLCLCNNNSMFANENLLKTNGTAIGVRSSCSYPDIVAASLDHTIMEH